MKKLLLLLTACLLLFCGCALSGDYLAYQRSALDAELDFTVNDRSFSALLSMSAPAGEDMSARDVSITFTAPENMRGVTVKRTPSSSSVSLGGVEIPIVSSALAGFFDIADAFSIDGTLDAIEAEGGINILSISSAAGNYTVFLDAAAGIPCKIDAEVGGRTIEMNIKKFTKK